MTTTIRYGTVKSPGRYGRSGFRTGRIWGKDASGQSITCYVGGPCDSSTARTYARLLAESYAADPDFFPAGATLRERRAKC